MKNKVLNTLIVLIPIIIILSSASYVFFNRSLHENVFERSSIFENYKELNDDVMDFIAGDKEEVETDMFTEGEKAHLADVKNLVELLLDVLKYALVFTAVILMYYWKDKELRRALYYGGIATAVVLVLVLLAGLINFNAAFMLFHKVFFPQGNYLFRTNLPLLYNTSFYVALGWRIFLIGMAGSGVLIAQYFVKDKKKR